jgi:hypothetical protein
MRSLDCPSQFVIDGVIYKFPHTFGYYRKQSSLYGVKIKYYSVRIAGVKFSENYIWGDADGISFYENHNENIPHWDYTETVHHANTYTLDYIRELIALGEKYPTKESVEQEVQNA